MDQQQAVLKIEEVNIKVMKRDYPLSPTPSFDSKRVDRLQKKEEKLAYKGGKAVDEGREKKADRLLKRAANVENRKIRISEKKN